MEQRIEIGRVVLSKAGRDKGRYFIIYDIIDNDHVYLADGSLRKQKGLKKKKIKHIEIKSVTIESIRSKLLSNKKVFDSEIRRAIESYIERLVKED